MTWLIDYAAMLITKYQMGADGKGALHRLHCQPVRKRDCMHVGKCVLWFVPRKLRSCMEPRWRVGIVLGRSWRSDQNFIGLSDGTVTRARAIARAVASKRWQPLRLERNTSTPWTATTSAMDKITEHVDPHASDVPWQEETIDDDMRMPKGSRIILAGIQRHVYPEHCPKCNLHKIDEVERAQTAEHTEACRERIYDLLLQGNSRKAQAGQKEGRMNVRAHGAPASSSSDLHLTAPPPTSPSTSIAPPATSGATTQNNVDIHRYPFCGKGCRC